MFTIDGINLAVPTAAEMSLEELGKTERAADGTLLRDVSARKRRILLRWSLLTDAELNALTAATDAAEFTVSLGTGLNAVCVREELRAEIYRIGAQTLWKDIRVTLAEK